MDEAWLIYNFGTQEPRIEVGGEFIALKERSRPLERLLGKAEGLWAAGEIVEREPERFRLTFPILEPALEYVMARARLVTVKLIATKSSQQIW